MHLPVSCCSGPVYIVNLSPLCFKLWVFSNVSWRTKSCSFTRKLTKSFLLPELFFYLGPDYKKWPQTGCFWRNTSYSFLVLEAISSKWFPSFTGLITVILVDPASSTDSRREFTSCSSRLKAAPLASLGFWSLLCLSFKCPQCLPLSQASLCLFLVQICDCPTVAPNTLLSSPTYNAQLQHICKPFSLI